MNPAQETGRALPAAAPAVRSRAWPGALVLALAFAGLVALVGPLHETPVQDDWDYARTVRIFLERGVIERSQIAQAAEVFTTLWGALFARVAGYSFVTLRFSTLTLSLASLLVFHSLLGELGFSRPRRLLGALTLLVCPLFIFLSHSFMTDVPTLFWIIAALALYGRGWHRQDLRLAVLASGCVALAFLTRQIGLVVALAAAAFTAWHAPRGQRLRWLGACALLPLAVAAVYTEWLQATGGVTWANSHVTVARTLSQFSDPQFPSLLLRKTVIALLTLGLYLLPVWLAALPGLALAARAPGRRVRPASLLVPALLGLVLAGTVARLGARGEWMPYMTDAFTRQGLRPYLAYYAYEAQAFRPDLLPRLVWVGLTLVTAVLGWVLAVLVVMRAATRAPAPAPAAHLVYWVGLGLAGVTLAFGEFYERFLLLLLPVVIVLALDATRRWRLGLPAAAVGLALVAAASVLLMRDFWGWMDVRWAAGQALLDSGVPADLIDGGYEWNGWHLYEPGIETLNRTGAPMSLAPWLSVLDPEYALTFTGLRGYHVERELTFPTPFGAGHDRLYVLRRDSPPPR